MSNALRVAHGVFGRVALLDMDRQLVRHAHPHCHVLLKLEGADTQFAVRDTIARLTGRNAVLINAWEPHAYAHDPRRPRTIILALYIEPSWLKSFRPNWAASGAPGFFDRATGELSPHICKLRDDLAAAMVNAPHAAAEHEALLAELMIAVIERFTPWRTVSTPLRVLARHSIVDPRIRRATELMRSAPGDIRDHAGSCPSEFRSVALGRHAPAAQYWHRAVAEDYRHHAHQGHCDALKTHQSTAGL
jgi:hypothetical protein